VHVGQLLADHGEFAQRRTDDLLLQRDVVAEHETEDGHRQQEQREHRAEPVVGQQGRQVGALVVGELVDDGDRQPERAVPSLEAV
jgi:hypothetical protein